VIFSISVYTNKTLHTCEKEKDVKLIVLENFRLLLCIQYRNIYVDSFFACWWLSYCDIKAIPHLPMLMLR